MPIISYSEDELGIMKTSCEVILQAKNKTELKQYKRDLISYMKLLDNLHDHLKLDYKEFQIIKVIKEVLCMEFPPRAFYDIQYEAIKK